MRRFAPVLLALSWVAVATGCGPKLNLTVRVLNDDNHPISEANVFVMGMHTQSSGYTDQNGMFCGRLHNVSGQVDVSIMKEGFYTIGWVSYCFAGQSNGLWLPWNPTLSLHLHERGNAVPMAVKQIDENVPVLAQPAGYDLLAGDWVPPFGHGKTSDFVFLAERRPGKSNEVIANLQLSFSNPNDGLLRIRLPYRNDYGLRLAAVAPEMGYTNVWDWKLLPEMEPGMSEANVDLNGDRNANYYFRVRSTTTAEGKIQSAMYGKIYWGVSFRVWEDEPDYKVKLLYYLNPDGTRNTEWDTRNNLCPNEGAGGRP